MGHIFKNPAALDISTPQGMAEMIGAVSAFLGAPDRARRGLVAAGVREITTASDFPDEIKKIIDIYHVGTKELDLGWQKFFWVRDFTGIACSTYHIRTATSGLTFKKLLPGEPARVYAVGAGDTPVTFDRYGGALEFLDQWFNDQELWRVEDRARIFRYTFYDEQADAAYALIEALTADQDVDLQGTADDDQVVRDVMTIDYAIAQILEDLEDTEVPASDKSTFVLVAPNRLRGRMSHALSLGFSRGSVDRREVDYNVSPVFTQKFSSNTDYYVGLAGEKSQFAIRQDLEVETGRNILSAASQAVGFGRYGGAIAEEAQVRRCATA